MQGILVGYRNLIAVNIASKFNNNVAIVDGDLKKGLVDEFRYNPKIIEIKKTGKELKPALERELLNQQNLLQTLTTKMDALKEKIDEEPTETNSNWRTERYPNLPQMPKSYDVYKARETMGNNYVSKENCDATCKLMYEYNSCCYNYCDSCIQIAMLNTLIKNVSEKKTYPLSLELATMLGL